MPAIPTEALPTILAHIARVTGQRVTGYDIVEDGFVEVYGEDELWNEESVVAYIRGDILNGHIEYPNRADEPLSAFRI